MDTSSHVGRAFLRRALTQSSNHAAWGFHRADGEREDYGLDGLLRWTDLTAHRFGCALRGMGRTLNGCGPQRPRNEPCPLTGLDIAISYGRKMMKTDTTTVLVAVN